jgi:serine/threonine protein kinase
MPQPSDGPSPSLLDRARALFDRTWEVSPAERAAWVQREANGDTKLVAEVMALLAAATQDDVSEGQDAVRQWLAIHDQHLNRRLAMKVLLERSAPRDEEEKKLAHQLLGRFLEEAQVTSQLDHPGVVPVHELGLDQNGKVYFTMRW